MPEREFTLHSVRVICPTCDTPRMAPSMFPQEWHDKRGERLCLCDRCAKEEETVQAKAISQIKKVKPITPIETSPDLWDKAT